MRRRGHRVPVVALTLAVVLSGCTSAPPSSITVAFELEGEARSVTLHPDVTCTETGVVGLSTGQGGPAGQFNFLDLSLDGTPGPGYGGIDDGPGLVRFETDRIELDRDTPGLVDIAETSVTVFVFADRAQSGPDYDDADATRVDGTLTAHLVCSAD